MNFWQDLPQPFTALAPMEDVTDIVFRLTVAKAARPNVYFTEFTNVASFCSEKGNFSTIGRLTFNSVEKPIVAQIWGTKPEQFQQTAQELVKNGFSGIDINMGCPAKDVVKIGAGSGLIRTPELAVAIIKAAQVGAGNLPVSVKTRLGYSREEEFRDWLPKLLSTKPANLTVHLRTKKEMSKVDARYEYIPEIVAMRNDISPSTKLTINGDIRDYAHVLELHKQYPGVDGFMIGRGVFANPYCFEKPDPNSGEMPQHSALELIDLLEHQLDLYDKYRQIIPDRPEVVRNFDSLKHFFKIYIRDFRDSSDWRQKLYACKDTTEIREVLANLKATL